MSTEVTSEEVQAIADEMRPAAGETRVQARDFRAPRRLSSEHLTRLQRGVQRVLPSFEQLIGAWVRSPVELALAEVSEVDSVGLFDELEAPACVQSFRVGDDLGWLQWNPGAMTAAAELVLGGEAPDEPRKTPLSRTEQGIVSELTGEVLKVLAAALELEAETTALTQSTEEIDALRDETRAGDTQRLRLHLTLSGLGGETDVRIHLPGVRAEHAPDTEPAAALPQHLDDVPVELGATLGSVEVGLAELLALEVGDVLPLGVSVGDPAELWVEDRRCGRALWGAHRGNLALRIQEMSPASDEGKA